MIVRRVRTDVVTTPPASSTLKGKERGRAPPAVEIVQVMREDDDDYDDEGNLRSDYADSNEDFLPGSPARTLAYTSAPNSQEDAVASRKSLHQVHGRGSPLASPSPSPMRASFPEPVSEEEHAQDAQKESIQGPNPDPPSSAEPTEEKVENDGIMRPNFTFTGAGAPRYLAWLTAVVLPLAEVIDDSADPRALFSDLQEIAQDESGSWLGVLGPRRARGRPSVPATATAFTSSRKHFLPLNDARKNIRRGRRRWCAVSEGARTRRHHAALARWYG